MLLTLNCAANPHSVLLQRKRKRDGSQKWRTNGNSVAPSPPDWRYFMKPGPLDIVVVLARRVGGWLLTVQRRWLNKKWNEMKWRTNGVSAAWPYATAAAVARRSYSLYYKGSAATNDGASAAWPLATVAPVIVQLLTMVCNIHKVTYCYLFGFLYTNSHYYLISNVLLLCRF